jgi:hypothetical protein
VSIWAWLAPLVVVVLAGIGVAVWLIVSALTSAITGPQDAVRKWATALVQQDCVAVFETTTPAGLASLGIAWTDVASCQAEATPNPAGVATVAFSSVHVTNGTADVAADITIDGSTRAFSLTLVNQGGKWVIDGGSFADGDTPDAPVTPQDTVAAYNAAWNTGNCDATLAYLSSTYLENLGKSSEQLCDDITGDEANDVDYTFTYSSFQITGSTATVEGLLEWSAGGKDYSEMYTYELLDNGGSGEEWLIEDEYPTDGDVQPVN